MTFIRCLVTFRVHFTIVILENGKYHFESRDLFTPLNLEKDKQKVTNKLANKYVNK